MRLPIATTLIEHHLYGAVAATQAVLPAMLEAGMGTLLYTGGGGALTPYPMLHHERGPGRAAQLGPEPARSARRPGIYAGFVAINVLIGDAAPAGVPHMAPDESPRPTGEPTRVSLAGCGFEPQTADASAHAGERGSVLLHRPPRSGMCRCDRGIRPATLRLPDELTDAQLVFRRTFAPLTHPDLAEPVPASARCAVFSSVPDADQRPAWWPV